MKKVIKFSMLCVLTLMALISLTSCGIIRKVKNIGENIGQNEPENTVTENMKSKEEIKSSLGKNYEITLKYGFTSTEDDDDAAYITTKCVNGAFYTSVTDDDGDTERYLVNGTKVFLDFDEDVQMFTECIENSVMNYPNVLEALMSYYTKSLEFNSKENGKYLGRDVTIYHYKQTQNAIVVSVSYNWEYVVDKETGLLLKRSLTLDGSSIEGSANLSTSFEVTSIKIGGVSLENEMKYAGIDSWLKKADFDRANASVVSPLTEGFVYSRAMYNDNGIASEIEYKYLVSGEEVFNSLARSFYDAGFNKDYDANVVDFEELLYSQFEGQKMFNGAIAEGDYRDFIIELELLAPYYDGGDYTLEITYYNNKE